MVPEPLEIPPTGLGQAPAPLAPIPQQAVLVSDALGDGNTLLPDQIPV